MAEAEQHHHPDWTLPGETVVVRTGMEPRVGYLTAKVLRRTARRITVVTGDGHEYAFTLKGNRYLQTGHSGYTPAPELLALTDTKAQIGMAAQRVRRAQQLLVGEVKKLETVFGSGALLGEPEVDHLADVRHRVDTLDTAIATLRQLHSELNPGKSDG